MSSCLFSPLALRSLELANRIVYSPMGQSAADDEGAATDWHLIHLGSMSLSGAGLIFTEATAVEPRGRGTPHGLALWTDRHEAALGRVIEACRRYAPAKHAIQLWHSGRKGSLKDPPGGPSELTVAEGGWPVVAPSPLPYPNRSNPVVVPDRAGLAEIREAFVASARRASRIGYDLLELHCAHGYLLHSFLSPLSNQRTDEYGGSLEARMRFPLEVFAALREAWPSQLPLGARVTATDWVEGGWTIEDSIRFASELKRLGCDYVTASSGGSSPAQKIKMGPGYQVRFAEQIRQGAGLPTLAVGQVWEPHFAEYVVASGAADLVGLGRGLVADPRWPWRAADALQGEVTYPLPYLKSHPKSNQMNLYRKVSGS